MDDKKKNEKESQEKAGEIGLDDLESLAKEEESVSVDAMQTALLQKVTDAEDKYKRALADYQNLVRRTLDEKREWARLANKDLVLKFLPILDILMLAEKHTKDQNFVLIVSQFLSVLEQEGVQRIKTVGEEFDPHAMEAVSTGDGEKGKVLDEARAGYMFYDTVLRPAQVVVGQ